MSFTITEDVEMKNHINPSYMLPMWNSDWPTTKRDVRTTNANWENWYRSENLNRPVLAEGGIREREEAGSAREETVLRRFYRRRDNTKPITPKNPARYVMKTW